jgi:hypothetical protein
MGSAEVTRAGTADGFISNSFLLSFLFSVSLSVRLSVPGVAAAFLANDLRKSRFLALKTAFSTLG